MAGKRTVAIAIENGRKIQNFESWNADSFYFYDASGNVAEFIVRYDLNNSMEEAFDVSAVLGINEIGIATNDIQQINKQLQSELGTEFWKGDLERFGTNGSQEGIFVMANYKLKEIWFPTTLKTTPEPFDAIIENKGQGYSVEFRDEELKILHTKS